MEKQTKSIYVRNVELGSGIPKICVPVVESRAEDILAAARRIRESAADLMEWRADCYEDVKNPEKTAWLTTAIRQELGDIPLLFTYRTKAEGGAASRQIAPEEYEVLNHAVLAAGEADIIDLELRMEEKAVERLTAFAHEKGKRVLMSSHDFVQTPSAKDMLDRFREMESRGADILKLAVMPKDTGDLLSLLDVCWQTVIRQSRPVVAISMGGTGLESRICAEAFGSAMTFGCLGKASAPGQMDAEELCEILKAIHRAR